MFPNIANLLQRISLFFKRILPKATFTGDLKLYLIVVAFMAVIYLMMAAIVGVTPSLNLEHLVKMFEALRSS